MKARKALLNQPELPSFRDTSNTIAPRVEGSRELQIHRLRRQGIAVEAIARQFHMKAAEVRRILLAVRVERLLETSIEYIANPIFHEPEAAAEIMGPMPESTASAGTREQTPPDGLPPYMTDLYRTPLLSREQEAFLFRKMNFLKSRASRLRDRIQDVPGEATDEILDEIERLQEEALAVKNQLIRANLRLVVSIAKRHRGSSQDFFELVSDGNMALIRSVEKFDYALGNKFSTYASWAIMRQYARAIPTELQRRDRFVTGYEEIFDSAADTRTEMPNADEAPLGDTGLVGGLLGQLNDRERKVLSARFGLSGSESQTLEQIGRELGVTKERVRQIEMRSLEKLRKLATVAPEATALLA